MQNSGFEGSREKSGVDSELRAVDFGGATGVQIVLPPRAVVKVPGAPKTEMEDEHERVYFVPDVFQLAIEARRRREEARSAPTSVSFSLSFARDNEVSDAIVHRQLQRIQAVAPSSYERRGKQYTPSYNGQWIFDALGCFEHRSMIYDAAARLARNHHLEPEHPEDLYNDAWYDYPLSHSFHVPAPLSNDDLISIRAFEAKNYGLVNTVLLSAYRAKSFEKVDQGIYYKRMSAKELAMELPYSPQTIGKYLGQLIGNGVFIAHPKCPKYFRCTLA